MADAAAMRRALKRALACAPTCATTCARACAEPCGETAACAPDGRAGLARLAQQAADAGFRTVLETDRLILAPPAAPEAASPGFVITLHLDAKGCIASFGGLVHEFDDVGPAIGWARRVMAGTCRLKVVRRGGKVRERTLQMRVADDAWIDVLASGSITPIADWLRRVRPDPSASTEHYYHFPGYPLPDVGLRGR